MLAYLTSTKSAQWLGYVLDGRGSITGRGRDFSSLPPRPDRLWGTSSLLSNGYRRLFPWGKAVGAWNCLLTSCRG